MAINNTNTEKTPTLTATSKARCKPLFSDREIRNIVRDFANAYIAGQVTITFPDQDDVMAVQQSGGKVISKSQAHILALDLSLDFATMISICVGTKEATPEEIQEAINTVFRNIIIYRNSQRIKGVFHDYGTESRLCRLEEGMEKVNKLIEELVEYLMKGN
jgi:hypothetical protein